MIGNKKKPYDNNKAKNKAHCHADKKLQSWPTLYTTTLPTLSSTTLPTPYIIQPIPYSKHHITTAHLGKAI